MKQLLIIRHAKSSWNNLTLTDFDRPLNDRGNQDAPAMAKRLKKKILTIDVLITSTANRALSTCKYFAKEFDKKPKEIVTKPELYHAGVPIFYEVISNLDNSWNTVAMFSHNPGITEFVNDLTEVKADNMPTCGIFAVGCKVANWKEFYETEKQFLFFDYPKLT